MNYRICAVIPCYRHVKTIEKIISGLKRHHLTLIIVDDGNSDHDKETLLAIANRYQDIYLIHHRVNLGKGSAVISGMRKALDLNFSHVLQIDADGQHDLNDLKTILNLSRENPEALVSGAPLYDINAPRSRIIGRQITNFFVHVECLSRTIADAMIGYRVYPVQSALKAIAKMPKKPNMTFDIEIMVRMYWQRVKILFFKTKIAYPENGYSNFKAQDNLKISLMHTKLCITMLLSLPQILYRKFFS